MAYATILVRVFILFLSPGRLIKKVGRDVRDGDFVYIHSAIFKYQTDLFYCAQDIGAVVCPFIYHYATHTGDGFRTVRHFGIIVRTDRTCVSGSGGNYPDPACLDARGCLLATRINAVRNRLRSFVLLYLLWLSPDNMMFETFL